MISQPLPRVFSFHNMAKAGKENQYGFSVLPAAARLENLGAKLGCCQLHTSHNAPCLRKHCFQFLQKKLKTKFMWLFFFFFLRGWRGGGGGEEGSKQGVLWEMCKWQLLFISTEERQVEIIDSVTHFRSKVLFENFYQSKWRRIVIIVIFIRKGHLCWGVSERCYRIILPTFVLFPDDAEFQVFPSTSWYVFM